MTGAFSMLSIYGTCAVLAGIAGRNKLLIKKEALVERLVLLCCGAPSMGALLRVKVPRPPDSGKVIAEHQGCPS